MFLERFHTAYRYRSSLDYSSLFFTSPDIVSQELNDVEYRHYL